MNQVPVLNLHLDEDLNNETFSDSRYGNDATCYGNACPDAGDKGQMREAPVFDGNEVLTISAADELNLEDLSISLWVKPTQTKNDPQILIHKQASDGTNRNFRLRMNSNSTQLRFGVHADNGSSAKFMDSSGSLIENQWNHVVATYDNAENYMAIYINGALDNYKYPSYTERIWVW